MRIIDRVRIWLRRILAHEPVLFAVCCCSGRCVGAVNNGHEVGLAMDNLNCWTCGKFGHGCSGPRLEER